MDGQPFQLRKPCLCGEQTQGVIRVSGGQNTVRCAACDRYAGFNAPKSETGESTRSVSKRDTDLKPSAKARIRERDNDMCIACGAHATNGVNLHIGHIISDNDGKSFIAEKLLTIEDLKSDENFVVLCDECNLGMAALSFRPRRFLAILLRLWRRRSANEAA